jgi:hypothetical protein
MVRLGSSICPASHEEHCGFPAKTFPVLSVSPLRLSLFSQLFFSFVVLRARARNEK